MGYWTGKRVVVLGGAGFIGSYLTEDLVKKGAKVRVIDDLSRGSLANLYSVRSEIDFIESDLLSPDSKKYIVGDVVLDLAARVGGMYYNMNNQTKMFLETMPITCNVISACIENKVPTLYFESTACVNDHDVVSPTPEDAGMLGEPEPTNEMYGWAKRMGERLCGWANKEHGLNVAIGRPWNAYGPERDYDDDETSHVIPALLKRIYSTDSEEPLVVFGHGRQERVYIYVTDLVEAILLTTERYAECDPVNLGVTDTVVIGDLARKLLQLTGNEDKPIYFDTTKEVGYEKRSAINTKLREVIGWEQKVSMDEGLRRVVDWYSEHRAPQLRAKLAQSKLEQIGD